MRTLKTEELELVTGAFNTTPAFENSQSKQNNGLGNGNQSAPGNSLANNGAENNLSNAGGTQGNNFLVTPN